MGPKHDGDDGLSRNHGGRPLLAQTGQGDHMTREGLGRLDLQHLARLWQHYAMSWEEHTANKALGLQTAASALHKQFWCVCVCVCV